MDIRSIQQDLAEARTKANQKRRKQEEAEEGSHQSDTEGRGFVIGNHKFPPFKSGDDLDYYEKEGGVLHEDGVTRVRHELVCQSYGEFEPKHI